MRIEFANEIQSHIADLMWTAESTEKIKDIIKVYGKDAEIVFHMIMAHYYDTIDDIDLAEEVLEKFRN